MPKQESARIRREITMNVMDAALHLNCFEMKGAKNLPTTDMRIITLNKVAELSSKEEFCCSQATD